MSGEDIRFMTLALEQAENAARAGEVPVGAVAVVGGKAAAFARNRVEEKKSVTAHAEIELLHELETQRGDWRMEDVTVYVTKEPCPMCAGALVNARVKRIVYGVSDPQFGGCSVFGIPSHPGALRHPEVTAGVGAEAAGTLLENFFRAAREERRSVPVRMCNHFDPDYAKTLNGLMRKTFDFDFDFWFRRGFWTESYESYSLTDGGRMIAHVGVARQRVRVNGKEFGAIQLGGVACVPEERGRGHARRLIDNILRRYSGTPAFLFANDSVLEFYPKFGFRQVEEKVPAARVVLDNDAEPVKCRPEELLELAGKRRQPASGRFDVLAGKEIRCFHLFGEYADRLYRLAPGLAVAAEQEGDTLKLDEIFAARPVTWETLAGLLPFRGIRRVEFGFSPDRLGVEFVWETPEKSAGLFVRGDWNLPENFRIPFFART